MKTVRLFVFFIGIFFCGIASAETIYVSAESSSNNGPGTSWDNAYLQIQAAVAIAMWGDTILVGNGVYDTISGYTRKTPDHSLINQLTITKDVTVRSLNGPEHTFITGAGPNGADAIRCVYLYQGVLDGFSLTGGHTMTSGDNDFDQSGGGLFLEGGTVTNCIISNCSSDDYAGGVFLNGGGTISDCVIRGCSTRIGGGGMRFEDGGTANQCTISNNTVTGSSTDGSGGGVICMDSGTLNDCTISGNHSLGSGYSGSAGGVACYFGGTLNRCTISDNTADNNAGGVLTSTSGTLNDCIIRNNSADSLAGGAQIFGGAMNRCIVNGNWAYSGGGVRLASGSRMRSCLVTGNSADNVGGGLLLYNGGTVDSCTLTANSAANSGGGFNAYGGGAITNSIIYGNGASERSGTDYTISYSCSPGLSGDGNISDDPEFINAAAGNYRIPETSPCVDSGTNESWMNSAIDLDENQRINNSTVDMGAYEYAPPFVNITTTVTTVPASQANIVLSGLSEALVGSMRYNNEATVISGLFTAQASWTTPEIELVYGPNVLTVTGTNVFGVASDSITVTRDMMVPGNALNFDGEDDYVGINHADIGNPSGNFTVECWAMLNSSSGSGSVDIISKHNNEGGSARSGYAIEYSYENNLISGLVGTSSGWVGVSGDSWNAGEWHHVALVYEASSTTLLFYDNGVKQGSSSCTPDYNLLDLYLGGSANYGNNLNGKLDEVRIWNSARSEVDIRDSMHIELTGSEGGLLAYYPLNESGTTAVDAADGSDGSLENGPAWIVSTVPCALVYPYQINLRGAWSSQPHSLMSSMLSVSNAVVAGTDYLVFGHDGDTLGKDTVNCPSIMEWRLHRSWQGEGYGIPSGDMQFDCSGIISLIGSNSNLRLLRADNANFSNAAIFDGVYANDTFTVPGHSFVGEYYYGLGELPSGPYTLYVDASRSDDSGAGTSWATAKKTIQAAVDLTTEGCSVLVAGGTYDIGGALTPGFALNNRVCVTRAITVTGVEGPAETFIIGASDNGTNGPAAVRCVHLADGAVLSGFTLTNGCTLATGEANAERGGGGVLFNHGGTVSNCVITGCSAAGYGGGVDHWHGGEISDSVIRGNHSDVHAGGIKLEGPESRAANCDIFGNTADNDGGGLYYYETGMGENLNIYSNISADAGAGVYLRDGGVLSHSTVAANTSYGPGGGLVLRESAMVDRCIIRGNQAGDGTTEDGGGIYVSTGGTARNCLIASNTAKNCGGGLMFGSDSSSAVVENCTIVSNHAGVGGGMCLWNGTVRNCIVYGNTAWDSDQNWSWGGNSPSIEATCTIPLTEIPGGTGCIAADPQFVSGTDFRLRSGSPCIDAAINAYVTDNIDLDGSVRIRDGNADGTNTVDMGCCEYIAHGAVVITNPVNGLTVDEQTASVDVSGTNNIYVVGMMIWTNSTTAETGVFSAGVEWLVPVTLGFGSNVIGVSGTNCVGEIASDTVTITRIAYTPVHYVSPNSPAPTWPYANWNSASHVLQDAFDAASSNDTVMVTDGVYTSGVQTAVSGRKYRAIVDRNIKLCSQNGRDHTFIEGASDNGENGPLAVSGILLKSGSVCGFTITNGYSDAAAELELERKAGGVLIEGGILTNCTVSGCSADWYAGVDILPGGLVIDCVIEGNRADSHWESTGGGGRVQSGAHMEGCLVRNNYSSYKAGGVYVDNDAVLERCIIQNNESGSGGGIHVDSNAIIRNSLIAGNTGGGVYVRKSAESVLLESCTVTDNDGRGMYLSEESEVSVVNCILFANLAANNPEYYDDGADITLLNSSTNDPLFISSGDYHLSSSSPCINAGANQIWMVASTDLDGIPRIVNTVDIGAYEYIHSADNYDGDAYSNSDEQIADTDPNDNTDFFRITAINNSSPFAVCFESSALRNYTLLGCTNLTEGAWLPLRGPRVGIGGTDSMTNSVSSPTRFYKLKVDLP